MYFVNEIINIIIDNLKYNKYRFENKIDNNVKLQENVDTIIYIDEIWKYIKIEKDNINLGSKVFELFKTIRKYNASIITITQDISDFFLLEDGNYGKSIINNSSFKVYFKLDFSDSEFLKNYYILNEKQLEKVNRLDKGQCMFCFNNSNIILNIKANEYENEILKGENNENYNST